MGLLGHLSVKSFLKSQKLLQTDFLTGKKAEYYSVLKDKTPTPSQVVRELLSLLIFPIGSSLSVIYLNSCHLLVSACPIGCNHCNRFKIISYPTMHLKQINLKKEKGKKKTLLILINSLQKYSVTHVIWDELWTRDLDVAVLFS